MEKHPSLAAQLMQRYNSGRTSHQTQDGVVVETGAVHGKAKKGAQGGNQGGPKREDKEDGPRKAQGRESPGTREPIVTSISRIIAAVMFFVLLLSCFL